MNIFGGSIREFLGMLVVCLLLGWLAWHEHGVAASADARCDTRIAVQANQQDVATQADQHRADADNIAKLRAQIQDMQSDAAHRQSIQQRLEMRLHDQQEVLKRENQKPDHDKCLDSHVPGNLIDSLHAGNGGAAKPPS